MSKKVKPFQKLMLVMLSGNKITKDEIADMIGKDVQMYRLSTYMWEVKNNGGVVKVEKDGRKLSTYQLINVDDCKKYLQKVGIVAIDKPAVESLQDLTTEQVTDKVTEQVA
jgi:hypothetical protein